MQSMRIEIVTDEEALATRAADIVCDLVAANPKAVLGLPTGATPVGAYFELKLRSDSGRADFSGVTAFAIDEFSGARRGDAGTNSAFFRQHLRLPLRAIHVPNPAAENADEHIRAYAAAIRRAGGLELCLLGIGANGHIAFNEPGAGRDSRARLVILTQETREQHAPAFSSIARVPARGVTLGIADLLEARALLVLASGAQKAGAVGRAIEGEATDNVPASWLREHGDVTWLLDEAAASALGERARLAAT